MKREVKRYAVFAALCLAALFLEGRVAVFGVTLNLTAPLAYFVGLRFGHQRGLLAGAVLGAIADGMTANSILGPGMLGKGTAGYMAAYLRGNWVLQWSPLMGMIWLGVCTMADGLLTYASLAIFSSAPVTAGQAALMVFVQAAAVCAMGLFIRPERHGAR